MFPHAVFGKVTVIVKLLLSVTDEGVIVGVGFALVIFKT